MLRSAEEKMLKILFISYSTLWGVVMKKKIIWKQNVIMPGSLVCSFEQPNVQ